MSSWHSYPKIYAVGHDALNGFFDGHVYAEEKIDGSQFSFGVFDGDVKCRSKNVQLNVEAPFDMFARAIETVLSIKDLLRDGWTYRAEYLNSEKHNTLKYKRTPNKHLMVFDINTNEESYLYPEDKREEAERIGLECVPYLGSSKEYDVPTIKEMLQRESVLGGTMIEGIVFKRFPDGIVYGPDKKALIAKYVSEAFKEVHVKEWKSSNQAAKEFVQELGEQYCNKMRWQKAVQHLRDSGLIENSPRDIPSIIKEIHRDIKDECKDEIADALLKYAMPTISRIAVRGAPEWYKETLLERQFE